MPYQAVHSDETKKRIVSIARRLFNSSGFDRDSHDEIILGAWLTHGCFYSFFKSKSDLYVEALFCFFTDPEWKNCWEGCEVDLKSTDVGGQVIRAYLSRQHFEDVENSCPMVALPADVTRGNVRLKRAFETVFAAMVSILERSVNRPGPWVWTRFKARVKWQLWPQRPVESAGDGGAVYRRHGCSASDGEPRVRRRFARCVHEGSVGTRRVAAAESCNQRKARRGDETETCCEPRELAT